MRWQRRRKGSLGTGGMACWFTSRVLPSARNIFAAKDCWGHSDQYCQCPNANNHISNSNLCRQCPTECVRFVVTLSANQVFYNPSEVTFEELCNVFFGRINPTQVNGQGGDRGTQYRTGVYPHTKEQKDVVRRISHYTVRAAT